MSRHEHYETLLSAWLDRQLDHREQIEMLDHLVGCEPCRRFHAEARQLDGLLSVVRPPAGAGVPPLEVWERIESATAARPRARAFGMPSWAGRVAAAILVVVGLGLVALQGPPETTPRRADGEVRLGGEAGRMTDERFIELTREVLGADLRYRVALHEIMGQVMEDTGQAEASDEGFAPRREEGWIADDEVEGQIPA